MTGQVRMHVGVGHEERVADELRARGWIVQPWGQGILEPEIRQALVQKAPIVLWRWIPDLIAIKGDRCYLVDPKSEINSNTPNFAIEIAAIQAHRVMSPLGLRIVYVWDDLTCNTPENLVPVAWFMPDPGRTRIAANGSGTPFALVRKDAQLPLNRIFGCPLETAK